MKRLRENLLWGAVWGMIAWQVYGFLEYTALTVIPLWRYSDTKIAAWNWYWNFVLLGFYTVAGVVTGGIGGALFGGSKITDTRNQHQRLRSIGSLTVALAFLANLLLAGGAKTPTLLITATIVGVSIWGLFSEDWARRLIFLTNPWGTALVLLFASWTGYPPRGPHAALTRLAITTGVAVAFIGASIVTARFKRPSRPRAAMSAAVAWGGLSIAFACAVLSSPGPVPVAGRAPAGMLQPPRPNVVLVTMDTVRADHLSLYGYGRNTTPNLDKLAQSATVFTHAMAAGNVTVISHAAIFTGLYGSWNGVGKPGGAASHGAPILDKYATIPVILAKNGYFTGAVVANTGNLQPVFGFDRGFQFFDSLTTPQLIRLDNSAFLRNGVRCILDHFTATTEFDLSTRRAEEINREAFGFLDQARTASRPFFLFLNYMDAHSAYAPPAPFDSLYPGKDGTERLTRYVQLGYDLAAGKGKLSQHDLQHFTSQYDGGIAYIDSQLGKLIDALKERGLYDNTLIVVTSDHGEALGDRNLVFHGLSVYQNQVHVPLIVKYPGDNAKQVVDAPVGHVDLLPTILDVAGIRLPSFLQGCSLRQDFDAVQRKVISEGFPRPGFAKLPGFNVIQRAIYEGKWKFVDTGSGRRELYDVNSDQAETHNVCSTQSAECAEMARDLDTWASMIPRDTSHYDVDSKTLERLRSLGYTGR